MILSSINYKHNLENKNFKSKLNMYTTKSAGREKALKFPLFTNTPEPYLNRLLTQSIFCPEESISGKGINVLLFSSDGSITKISFVFSSFPVSSP